MQVERVEGPVQLGQGSIFSIEELTFTFNGQKSTLHDFYPKVDLRGVRFGIVLSQDCDLFRGPKRPVKVPYISIGFLEPLSRYIRRDKAWGLSAIPWALTRKDEERAMTLISPAHLGDLLRDKFKDLLKNEDKCHFFASFEEEVGDLDRRYCVVNLTKAVPIRVEHYDEILAKVSHKLKSEFGNKLGWKLAELYGRVGTRDYTTDETEAILRDLQGLAEIALKNTFPNPLRVEQEDFKRAVKLKTSAQAEKQRYIVDVLTRLDALAEPKHPIKEDPPNVVRGDVTQEVNMVLGDGLQSLDGATDQVQPAASAEPEGVLKVIAPEEPV